MSFLDGERRGRGGPDKDGGERITEGREREERNRQVQSEKIKLPQVLMLV